MPIRYPPIADNTAIDDPISIDTYAFWLFDISRLGISPTADDVINAEITIKIMAAIFIIILKKQLMK